MSTNDQASGEHHPQSAAICKALEDLIQKTTGRTEKASTRVATNLLGVSASAYYNWRRGDRSMPLFAQRTADLLLRWTSPDLVPGIIAAYHDKPAPVAASEVTA